MFLQSFIVLLLIFSMTAGEGINCKGSSGCTSKEVLRKFMDDLATFDESKHYKSGEHIACMKRGTGFLGWINPNDGYCLFLQGVDSSVNGMTVKRLLENLINFGCEGCGSIPILYPQSNDPSYGILTSNYVSNRYVDCDGLC